MIEIEIPEHLQDPELVPRALEGHVDGLPPSAALAMLPYLDITVDRHHELLRDALGNHDLTPQVRALAVLALPRLPADLVLKELEALLHRDDVEEVVTAKALTLLARVGDERHLSLLARVRERPLTRTLQSCAAYAEALIVHRLGLNVPIAPLPVEIRRPRDDAPAELFRGRRLGLPRQARAVAAVRRMFPSVGPHDHAVYELPCGTRNLAVVVREDLLAGPGLLRERPYLAAVVATPSADLTRYTPILVALTTPAGDAVALRVARLTGRTAYAGTGTFDVGRVVFDLFAADLPGLPAIMAMLALGDRVLRISGRSTDECEPGAVPAYAGVYELP